MMLQMSSFFGGRKMNCVRCDVRATYVGTVVYKEEGKRLFEWLCPNCGSWIYKLEEVKNDR